MSTDKFFCFNNNVSNLYNNSVVVKIIGMAYIFTFLMFRKPNKITISKNKRQFFIDQRPFDSRLYLDISRSFKCLKSSPVVCLICYYLRLVIFILREYILKVHILVSSEHKLFQIWNTCVVSCILFFLNQLLISCSYKSYYQESNIIIIAYSSVVTVAEWLDGSFENQNGRWKAQQWFDNRKSQNMFKTF
jgi:hypothetical protein